MAKQQVRYVDSNGNDVVLAAHNTSKTDPDLSADAKAIADRLYTERDAQGFQKAKIWTDSGIVGEVPTKRSKFDTARNGEDEPEVLIEEWNGSSWDIKFRGFPKNKPVTDNDGQAVLVLRGFGFYTGKQDANHTTATTTDIADALAAILPSGYAVDAAPDADWPGGSVPSVSSYTLNGTREKGYNELMQNYDASIQFTNNLDSNNDYKVRLEPIGHGSSFDTIYGPEDIPSQSDTLGVFREWQPEDLDDIVNKVEVIGTDSNGNDVVGTASDASSQSDYGVRFHRIQVAYDITSSEADSIASNLLQPDPTSGGVIKVPQYDSVVVNRSFTLDDSRNNIDAEVHTAIKTRNYYHESAVEIVFDYETGSQAEAQVEDQLDSERKKIVAPSSVDVGQQSEGTLANDQANAQVGGGETAKGPSVSGNSTFEGTRGSGTIDKFETEFANLNMDGTWETVVNWNAGTANYLFIAFDVCVSVMLDWRNGVGQTGSVSIRVENTTDSTFYPNSTGRVFDNDPGVSTTNDLGFVNMSPSPTIPVPRNITGDDLDVQVKFEGFTRKSSGNGTAVDALVDAAVLEELSHQHQSKDYSADSHEHGVTHNDSGHGDSGTSEHVISGKTSSKNVDVATKESKKDR